MENKVGRFWSARIGFQYWALGVEVPDEVLWFWIGIHADFPQGRFGNQAPDVKVEFP